MGLFGKNNKEPKQNDQTSENNQFEEDELYNDRHIIGGIWGDRDKRTRKGVRNMIIMIIACILTLIGSVSIVSGQLKYNNFLINNTTPLGTALTFTKSKTAKLNVASVWTDKQRKTIIVNLAYDSSAHAVLSSSGNKYKLRLATSNNKLPKGIHMEYGLLGTDGNGYLFLRSDKPLTKRAYQIFITNQLKLSSGSVDSVNEDADTTESDKSITADLSDYSMDSVDSAGVISRGKGARESIVDSINFRVNPYSDTTQIYKGSFLNSDGSFDYKKIIQVTTVKRKVAQIDKSIRKQNTNLKALQKTLIEYQGRLKENPNDATATTNISTTKDSIESTKSAIESLNKKRSRYLENDLNKESFGKMQTKFKYVYI